VSAVSRDAALREWWAGLTRHAWANAHTAALDGAYLPDRLLRELVEAGVIAVKADYFTHRTEPVDGFPMPADVCTLILTHHPELPRG